MYHRIADPAVDPWGLAVSPQNFRSQLDLLRRRRTPCAMDDFVAGLKAGTLPRSAVALTFDDGYVDNLTQAKPLLEEYAVSATIFITAGRIGCGELFWWDELAKMVLLKADAFRCVLPLPQGDEVGEAGPIGADEPRRCWRAWQQPVTARESVYHRFWSALQRLDAEARGNAMKMLQEQLGVPEADAEELPMTAQQLAAACSPMIAFGGHGMTHQPLTAMDEERQRGEIAGSRSLGQQLSGVPLSGFAYPHGDLDARTAALVREAGYDWACSTRAAAVDPAAFDLFELPRIMATDSPGADLIAQLETAE